MAEKAVRWNVRKRTTLIFPARGERLDIEPKRIETVENGMRKDQNTVDLDKSMADLAENTILYTALAQIVAKKFDGMKAVINEGK